MPRLSWQFQQESYRAKISTSIVVEEVPELNRSNLSQRPQGAKTHNPSYANIKRKDNSDPMHLPFLSLLTLPTSECTSALTTIKWCLRVCLWILSWLNSRIQARQQHLQLTYWRLWRARLYGRQGLQTVQYIWIIRLKVSICRCTMWTMSLIFSEWHTGTPWKMHHNLTWN